MQMEIKYGHVTCEGLKSNNWKRMHGIPLKAKARTRFGGEIFSLSKRYVSKRSRKKQKKAHFRNCFNPIVESKLCDTPDLKRVYHRYGYMKKTTSVCEKEDVEIINQ